jgi:hypothetical protein
MNTFKNLLLINYHMKIEQAPNFRLDLNFFFSPILALEICTNSPPTGSTGVHHDDCSLQFFVNDPV